MEQKVLHAVSRCVLKSLTLKTFTATGVWFIVKNSDGSGAPKILSILLWTVAFAKEPGPLAPNHYSPFRKSPFSVRVLAFGVSALGNLL